MNYNNSEAHSNASIISIDSLESPLLTRILHEHADETISDAQIQRVLTPVLEMIRSGKFNRQPSYDHSRMLNNNVYRIS